MYIILAVILVLILYTFQFRLYQRKWSDRLKVNARFNIGEVYEGEEASLQETIENAKLLPLPMVKMKLQLSRKLLFHEKENTSVSDFFNRTDIYTIKANQRVIRTLKFTCSKRGYFDFHEVDVLGSDLFLTKEFVHKVDTASSLYVYPKKCDSDILEPVLNKVNGEIVTKRNYVDDPFLLRGIREYQTYDSMKNINWKASAKTGELMVNMHDYTSKRSLRVFLYLEDSGLRKENEIKELCISMVMSLVDEYAEISVPVCFYSNTSDVLTGEYIHLDEGCGKGFTLAVKKSLARINLDKRGYSYNDSIMGYLNSDAKDSFTVIISPYMKKDFQDMLIEYSMKNSDFCWICPFYKDSLLKVDDSLLSKTIQIDGSVAIYEASKN